MGNSAPARTAVFEASHANSFTNTRAVIMSVCRSPRNVSSLKELQKTVNEYATRHGGRLFSQAVRTRTQSRCAQQPVFRAASPRHSSQVQLDLYRNQGLRFLHGYTNMKHRAFVAFGSNMGDRVAMIEQACNEMEHRGKIKIVRTSSLWETKAMYVLDQSHFVNGACEVSCVLSRNLHL